MASTHSRNASDQSASSSYSMMMEHVLQYPGSYEIPLRTMYTLNCAPRAQPLPHSLSRAPSPSSGAASPTFAWNDTEHAAMSFSSQLMSHIESSTQQSSLPPTFIINFVSRVFHPCLALVDFPQALTALDYLRDLEKRRCKEFAAVFARLGIRLEALDADVDAAADRYPGLALWARNMQDKNRKVESYYSAMYLGLRRWIMINELSLQPFNKFNCIGMLNTLLPPQAPSGNSRLPTPLLSAQLLTEERNSFFEYIKLVEAKGPAVLKPIIELHRGHGDETGWDNLQKNIDKYLRVTKSMLDDCAAKTGISDFTAVEDSRKNKKTDSGVSFGSEKRPSTASGSTLFENPSPTMPAEPQQPTAKGLSKMERLQREFKRMRVKSRPDVEEIVKIDRQGSTASTLMPPASSVASESKAKKSLKKARSFANLAHLRVSNNSSSSLATRAGSNVVPFDPEEMKRHRMMYESQQH